jgi:gliding motility-associated-like protein
MYLLPFFVHLLRFQARKRVWVALSIFLFFFNTQSFGQCWTSQNSAVGGIILDVYFLDTQLGWAVSNQGKILKTTNGGSNWVTVASYNSTTFYSIYFLNSQIGWATGFSGLLMKTVDGGTSWTTQSSSAFVFRSHIFKAQFLDSQTGWVAGNGGIAKTTDGGNIWRDKYNIVAFSDFQFLDNQLGWGVGNNGAIMKTVDGGDTWLRQTSTTTNYLYSVFFIDSQTGWVVGENGTILKTSNGGNTWLSQNSTTTTLLHGIHFTDSQTGWAVGNSGIILKTVNGGISWIAQNSNTTNYLATIYFSNGQNGWIVGENGTILKTNTVPSVNLTTTATSLCQVNNATLTANVLESNLQFQWSKDGQIIIGQNTNLLTVTQGGSYSVKVSRANLCDTTLTQIISNISCRCRDSLALVAFYNSTGGLTTWTRSDNWLTSNPIDTWYGIRTNTEGCVTCIDLDGVPNCGDSGTSSGNNLTDTLTNLVDSFKNLTGLYLGNNRLMGKLPNIKISTLQEMCFHGNDLDGNISNFNLPSLFNLCLSTNRLEDTIPNFNLMPNLFIMSLNNNQLIGSIPDFKLPNLVGLRANSNLLSGTIPRFDSTFLLELYLDNNQLSGSIPNFNLRILSDLRLHNNQLSGNIPNFNFTVLRELTLGQNQLSDTIPNFNLPNLAHLELEDNILTGKIPNFNLPKLKNLYLYNNRLSGTVPNFDLPKLEVLHFFQNSLDSCPRFTKLPNIKKDTLFWRGIRGHRNKFTFNDILPNMNFATSATFVYNAQDSIFTDTTYQATIGSNLTINLGIDDTVTTNVYNWYKNNSIFRTDTGTNKLIFNNIQLSDRGVYRCKVTNRNAPALTLNSRNATVVVNRLSVCWVTNTNDSGVGSLREAINCTNSNTGADTIKFALSGSAPWIFAPTTIYPKIVSDSVVIDATSQVGWRLGKMVINGNNIFYAQGTGEYILNVDGTKGAEIYGLAFTKTPIGAIWIANSTNFKIGASGKGNVFYDNGRTFLNAGDIYISSSQNGKLQGNILGLDENLLFTSNPYNGLNMRNNVSNIQIGGSRRLGEGNIISKYQHYGIRFGETKNSEIYGNNIGTATNGTENMGNIYNGIYIVFNANANIKIGSPNDSDLENWIAYNGWGITREHGNSNVSISRNKIYCNSTGIKDYNSPKPINPPIIQSAKANVVTGTTGANNRVEVFTDANCSTCQGKTYLGTATADANGNWSLNGIFSNGSKITATTTDTQNNTSEFAACVTVCSPPSVSVITSAAALCGTKPITISVSTAQSNLQYKWAKDGQTLSQTSANLQVSQAGSYAVTVSNSSGCDTVITKIIGLDNSCRCSDSIALVALYNTTGGANTTMTWTRKDNWLSNSPISTWYGVFVNSDGCVVGLDFDGVNDGSGNHGAGNGLKGAFPDAVFNMSALKTLFLSGNSVISLPNAIGRLKKLTNFHVENCGFNASSNPLPDSLWTLTQMEGMNLSNNAFYAPMPTKIGQLTNLAYLLANNCGWSNESATANALVSLQTLKKLGYLDLSVNRFSDTLSPTIWTIDSLGAVILRENKLTSLGTAIPRRAVLFDVQDNRLTRALNFSSLPIDIGTTDWGGLRLKGNRLTFEHILPNMTIASRANRFFYSPQDSVFKDTTLTSRIGDPLSIKLNFDDTVRSNSYQWRKIRAVGDTLVVATTATNSLLINRLQASDAGVYEVRVTNSIATQLTLYSRKITIVATPNLTCRYNDSLGLAAFYRSTNMQNIPPQYNPYKWDLNQPMTTWLGVTLNASGCVQCLDLDGGAVDCTNLDPNPSGIGLVGTLPDSIRLLTSLERLVLQGNTGLDSVLPPNFGNLTSLKHFYAYNCRFTGPFPASFWTLPNIEGIDLNDNPLDMPFPSEFGNFRKLKELHLCSTGLRGTIPQTIGTLPDLGNLDICDNQLTGSVPTNLTTRAKLQVFQVEMNKLDVLPNFSALPFSAFEPRWIPFFSLQNNRFTFDDIVPNMPIINRISHTYANQDSIFQTITYTKNVGETLTIDLGIDAGLSSNKYVWIKNGVRFDSSNQNTLILRGLSPCDAGTYRCEVTNTLAPSLTLKSRVITLIVNGLVPTYRLDTTLCGSEGLRLPNGQIVTLTTSFRDTLKNTRRCDSLIRIVNLTVNIKPTAQILGLNSQYCRNNTLVGLQGQPAGGTFKIDGVTASNFTPSVLSLGNHTVSYIFRATNGCSDTATKTMRLADAIRNNLNRVLCVGESIMINNKVYNQNNRSGVDTLRNRAINGCDSIVAVQITMQQKVNAVDDDFEMTTKQRDTTLNVSKNDIYPANLYELRLLQQPIIGTLQDLNNGSFKLSIPNATSGTVVFKYQLCALNCANDCDSATVRVQLKGSNNELDPISTGITPNGDGKNDILDLPTIDWTKYPESDLEIYNRWGQKVYAAAPYKRDWTGQNTEGSELPAGDYFLILRLSKADGKIVVGNVYLAR